MMMLRFGDETRRRLARIAI